MAFQPDHYLFWRVDELDLGRPVQLQGQFDPAPFGAVLSNVELLGNPVTKYRDGHAVEEIHEPTVHLLAYSLDLKRPGPSETVIVRNQFTGANGQPWQLGVTQLLLVPANKSLLPEPPPETPPPPLVDHFLCYDVTGVPQVHEPITFRDQFGETKTAWLQPLLFGVPADKNGEGILHPKVRLAVYEISDRHTPDPPIFANTRDQFGPFGLGIRESFWLAVPSLKEWKPSTT